MRIIDIRIRNLASLATNQPHIQLGQTGLDEGLLAITGATGSGKSTILDAVCLALYGNTPRLPGRGEDRNAGNILTRGARDGFAEVDFQDDNGVSYRSRWDVRVSKSGNAQPPQMTLVNRVTDEEIARGVRHVNDAVTEIIGLARDQFVGVVLLSQGSFSTFLQADSGDRGLLLEKITGVDRYSKLGTAAFLDQKLKQRQCDILQGQMDEHPVLSLEQREALEQQQREVETQYGERQTALKQAQQQQHLWDALQRAETALRKAVVTQEQAEKGWFAAHSQRERLQHAEAAEALRAELQRVQDRQAQCTQIEHNIKRADADIALAAQQVQQLTPQVERLFSSIEHTYTHAEQQRDAQQHWQAANPERCASIQHALDQVQLSQAQLDDTLARIERGKQILKDHAQVVQQAQQQFEQQQQQQQRAQKELQQSREALAILEDKHGDVATLTQQHANRQHLLAQHDEYAQLEAKQLTLQQAHITELEEQQAVAQQLAKAEGQAIGLATGVQHAQTLLRLALSEAHVAEHRSTLQTGEACPLCLQTVHNIPHVDVRAHGLEAAEAEMKRAERALAEAQAVEHELSLQQQRLRTQQAHRVQHQEDIAQRQEALVEQYQQARNHDAALPTVFAQVERSALLALIQASDEQRKTLQHAHTVRSAAQQRCDQITTEFNKIQTALNTATTQFTGTQSLLDERRITAKNAQADVSQTALLLQQRCTDLAEALSIETPTASAPIADVHAWLKQCRDGYHQWEGWSRLCQAQHQLINDIRDRFRGHIPALTSPSMKSVVAETNALKKAEPLQISSQLEQQVNGFKDCWSQLIQAQQGQKQSLQQRDLLGQQAQQAQEAHTIASDRLQTQLQTAGFADQKALEAVMLTAEDRQTLRQQMQHIDAERTRSTALLQAAQTTAHEQRQQWIQHFGEERSGNSESINAVVVEKQAAYDATLALRQQLRSQIDHDRQNSLRAGELAEQLQAAQHDLVLAQQLAQLIGSRDGRKFRDIAQAFSLESLVAHANKRLRQFAPRFALQRRSGLDIHVIDHDLAGEVRSVSTLSGGETFLVSLALALALADLKRGQHRIESVFIDEGFGSLDKESLDRAIAALETVQNELGAQLIVISHVGELQHRWQHVHVQRVAKGRSWLQVPGGPPRPPRMQKPAIEDYAEPIDMDVVILYLQAQMEPKSRNAIAQDCGLAADSRLSEALKNDARIAMIGRRYALVDLNAQSEEATDTK